VIRTCAEGEGVIQGVAFKELQTFPDERGFFRELVRTTDPFFAEGFGQWSHSKMGENAVKAWHFHHRQLDWWYCPIGVIHAVLYDLREESPTFRKKLEFYLGDQTQDGRALTAVVCIPAGVAHGCRVLSQFAHLFYLTSCTYDPQDEGRYPFDSDVVPHTWGESSKLVVAERDRRTFIPPYPRIK
jgi:dTDP-4-dehydrorhamnose 3,5-epimerase